MTVESPVQRVHLTPAAHTVFSRECGRSLDGNETGGILLGHLHEGVAEVRVAGDPGPTAVRQPDFFLRDLGHARQLAHDAFTRDGSIWIGEWHTHLAAAPVPSERDLATYARLLADPDLGFEAIVSIIAVANPGWDRPAAYAWTCFGDQAVAVPLILSTDEYCPTATEEHR
ncbi:Mov34/MPN/PAD-1 family protein [Micromonospora foliorum]|uniref:Mov34/MPN/PAD-1 family protein n=1 Tax=Micromonospora foliorum TaxID=2911210 RepID=UPI001EE88624|nr:Mov34/MPN/PAD-1 family protein [Micromonospora foliorum]MCG5435384.1 Mov34/MPN/PAD-1 family protein [Micromonospora foliorum]